MLDLLAAIVSVDPPSLLGWLVLALAAGMYPVGIMLGSSCSACCSSCPCTEGVLPETVTVTFSGLSSQTNKCCDYYNGLNIVLKRDGCKYEHRMCGVGNLRGGAGLISAQYNGPAVPMTISIISEVSPGDDRGSEICNTLFAATQLVGDCSFPSQIAFQSTGGASATLTAGGQYDATFKNAGGVSCFICCKGSALPPLEIEATFTDPRTDKPVDFSGTYVLRSRFFGGGNTYLGWQGGADNGCVINIGIEPCSSQTVGEFTSDFGGTGQCNDCHRKCRKRARVQLRRDLALPDICEYRDAYSFANPCAMCESTPICSLAGMSFSLSPMPFGTGCGGILTLTTE